MYGSDIEPFSTDEEEEVDDYFFEHPTEKLGCLKEQEMYDMFVKVDNFFHDNYLPRSSLDLSNFVQWINDTGYNGVDIAGLHKELNRFDVYDKSPQQLTYFLLWNILKTTRRS